MILANNLIRTKCRFEREGITCEVLEKAGLRLTSWLFLEEGNRISHAIWIVTES